MSLACDSCRRLIRGEGRRTATRTLCDVCYDTYLGAAAGSLSSGFDVSQTIATAGWYANSRK
ncbi:hypothetical protein [Microbacterium paludicola]|uniref:hypothetical protein n=1 Tax=Microbacterium paludicola TaxID=300019 RepID=UPI0031DEFD04